MATSPDQTVHLAVDLGAGSGRVMAGIHAGGRLTLEEVHRFPSASYQKNGHSYWDIREIFGSIKEGIRRAVGKYGDAVVSLGVDSWGVDYGLLDFERKLIHDPCQYRDARTRGMMERAFARLPKEEIYRLTGIQFLEFNTLYQLLAEAESLGGDWSRVSQLLFIPDLINFWLTGKIANECTISSTSQMLDPANLRWDAELMAAMDLPRRMILHPIPPGEALGPLLPAIQQETGTTGLRVLTVGSHDTASAVAGVPARGARPVFISSGTWSVLGRELPGPVINEASCAAGFSNEAGVAGTTRFLKNITGMWLLQECLRVWKQEDPGFDLGYADLVTLAQQEPSFTALINPDDEAFHAPAHMPAAIADACRATGQPVPETPARFTRIIFESLALRCRDVLGTLKSLTDGDVDVLHIVGGGSQNALLNQWIADATGHPVEAGPVEATAAGNVLLQLIGLGQIPDLAAGRALLRESFTPEVFQPQNTAAWSARHLPGTAQP